MIANKVYDVYLLTPEMGWEGVSAQSNTDAIRKAQSDPVIMMRDLKMPLLWIAEERKKD